MRRNSGLTNDIHPMAIRLGIQNLSKYFQGRSVGGGANGEIPAAGGPFDKKSAIEHKWADSAQFCQNG
jgi:hypothetical protein